MIKVMFFFLMFYLIFSCDSDQVQKEIDWNKKKSMELNHKLAQKEKMDILMYLENHQKLDMKQTGSGLFYQIVKKNEQGLPSKPGLEAAVKYKISFLNGDVCYETPKGELSYFKIDHSDIESYVIIDDDNDMLKSQKDNFVLTVNNRDHEDCVDMMGYGLTKKCAEKAIEILNKN